MVWPNISTISSGKLDMAASPETNDFRVYPLVLKEA
jgi:hypothetical protein